MTSKPLLASAPAHPGHAFDGMRVVEAADGSRLVTARCHGALRRPPSS